MRIEDSTVVVTGGASGIGRALAMAFGANGARVVVGDVDEAGAHRTAGDIRAAGGAAIAMRADAADPDHISALLSMASEEFTPVDTYVANAGIIGAPGLATEDDWDRILEVNLRAHVRAARLLVPHWCSVGAGHFVAVASAAGLLSQIGAAGYAVSKHAAVGFAEWLAITYGDSGIGVSCVCPLGVDTPLLDAVRTAEDPDARRGAASILQSGEVITAERVAADTLDAVRQNRFLVTPHPEVIPMYRMKGADYDRWIEGMRRYQRSLD